MHLSTDGATVRDNENASIGGVLQDYYGNWILRFNHYLRRCTFFEVKLCGILDSFLILLSKRIKRVIIQTNKLEVFRVLQGNAMTDSGIIVFRRIQWIMKAEGQWRIRYVPRECNLVADCLAKLSLIWRSSL